MIRLVVLIGLSLSCHLLFGQDQIIDLYKDTPPYSTGITSKESWVDHRVSNVQIPQLYIYKPKKEKANGVTVIYCPGGGYRRLSIPDMGKGYGQYFNEFGVTLIILKYRLPVSENLTKNHLVPFTDVTQAIRLVRSMANELNIDPDKVGIMGGSAGGHLASTLSTRYDQQESPVPNPQAISSRPDFTILVYPVISMDTVIAHMGSRRKLLGTDPDAQKLQQNSSELNVTSDTPPTFIVHGTNDASVSVLNSVRYYEALIEKNVAAELHIFQDGKHGSGLGKSDQPWSYWKELCKAWMHKYVIKE